MISSVLKKLRYKPGMRVAVLGAPAGFEVELARAKDLTRAKRLGKDLDLVQAFFTRRSQLERDIERLKVALAPDGILWICYPKANALGTDLNRDVIREAVKDNGLEAVSIVAIDEVWSGLRLKVE